MLLENHSLFITLFVTVVFFTIFWGVHVRIKDAGVIDLYWGPGFAVIALISVGLSDYHSPFQYTLLIATIIWAIRIGLHIGLRHHKSTMEDRRYAQMRNKAGDSFWWLSFFKIFLLQAVLMWLIATPQHLGLLYTNATLSPFARLAFYIGLALFLFGLIIETIADWQLSQFKNKQENLNKTMSDGLWAYSRHPNYFGEVVLWWGFGLMAYALSGSLIAFGGPALLTFLILKVSGVTMLENHLKPEKDGYADYIKSTSAFFPMWRR